MISSSACAIVDFGRTFALLVLYLFFRLYFLPVSSQIMNVLWWYYFSKLIEFMDTFFFILRKNNHQITFLHIYHHASMLNIWWFVMNWIPCGHCEYFECNLCLQLPRILAVTPVWPQSTLNNLGDGVLNPSALKTVRLAHKGLNVALNDLNTAALCCLLAGAFVFNLHQAKKCIK